MKKKRCLTILIIILVIVLSLGIMGWLWYQKSPQAVWTRAIHNLGAISTQYSGTLQVRFDPDDENSDATFEFVLPQNHNLYFRATNLNAALADNDEDADIVDVLEGEWWELPLENVPDWQNLFTTYKQAPFIQVQAVTENQYVLAIDSDNLTNFLNQAFATDFDPEDIEAIVGELPEISADLDQGTQQITSIKTDTFELKIWHLEDSSVLLPESYRSTTEVESEISELKKWAKSAIMDMR